MANSLARICVVLLVFAVAIWLRLQLSVDTRTFNRYTEGVHLMQTGRPYEAVAAWEALRHDNPRFPDTYLRLAEYYQQNGNPARSIDLLREMARLRLDAAQQEERREMLAEAYNGVANATTALQAAQSVVKAYPNSSRAHLALAEAYNLAHNRPGVTAEMANAERLSPDDAGLYMLGAQYGVAQNDPDQAAQQAEQCVKLAPNSADGWYLLGCALKFRPTPENVAESIVDLRRSIQLNATAYSTWLELGNALILSGQRAAAIPCVERAQIIAATNAPANPADAVKLLGDRMRISLILVQCYHHIGNSVKEAEQRRDSNRFAAEILEQTHQAD